VTNPAQIQAATEQLDSLDPLINNAGVALYDGCSTVWGPPATPAARPPSPGRPPTRAALHGLLARLHDLGSELLEGRRTKLTHSDRETSDAEDLNSPAQS
jgi:hypothetical protein